MRNLRPYNGNCIEVHRKIVSNKSKKNKDLFDRLDLLTPVIEKQYVEFENKFKNNDLENITPAVFNSENKNDLYSLYNFKLSLIKDVKKNITAYDGHTIVNTCQNCTINEVHTLDHYLPKNDFSEFVVNPKNLFPCCSYCNSLKGDSWLRDGKRIFLNLYLDILPQLQYLFVEVTKDGQSFNIKFFLKNIGVSKPLFRIIETHYKKLNLLERFRENANDVISELRNTMESREGLQINDIRSLVLNKEAKNKISFGHNYWRSILRIELVNNKDFINCIK